MAGFNFLTFWFIAYVCICPLCRPVHTHGTAQEWVEVRGHLQDLVFSSHHMCFRGWIHVYRLGRNLLYPLNHLASPFPHDFKDLYSECGSLEIALWLKIWSSQTGTIKISFSNERAPLKDLPSSRPTVQTIGTFILTIPSHCLGRAYLKFLRLRNTHFSYFIWGFQSAAGPEQFW